MLAHAAVGVPLRVLHFGDDEHRVTVGRVVDGRRRQRNNLARLAERKLDLHKHSRTQFIVFVGDRGLHLNVSRLLIDDRIERCDAAGERHAWKFAVRDAQNMAGYHFGSLLLGHSKIHIDRAHRLQGDNRLPCRQILTQTDLPNSQHSRERSVDRLASNRGANVTDLRLGRLLLGRGIVILRLGDDPSLYQFLGAAVVDLGQIALSLKTGQLRLLLAGIEFDQNVPLVHPLARLKMDFVDRARQVGTHGDSLNRSRRTDHRQRRGPRLPLSDHGCDRSWRRLEACTLGNCSLNLPEFCKSEAPQKGGNHN